MLLRHIVLSSVFLSLAVVRAATDETIVTKRINSQNRLIPLKKVTVGPDDQYQGSMDPTGKSLIFTRKSDLVPHLCRQDSKTGEVTDFLPLNADSQEAAISPTGLVAFTYYKFNARGDICYRPIDGPETTEITCLKGPEGEKSSPFWKSEDELAYVVRDMKTLTSQIVAENIKTQARQTLVEGKVWSPGMKVGGKYLFYNQLVEDKNYASRNLTIKDLSTGKTKTIQFMLPGISGFPAVASDEKSVFFSQYLNDTNNDNIIDGKDNSVIFRASIDTLLQQNEVFPEELTSIESNCSFPRPTESELFVTCAFEGALDIYRIPLTGVIPPQWDEKLLWNAHQTARTYQERILILNTLRFRSQSADKLNLDERIFGDHLLADDIAAAQFYLRKVQDKADPETKEFLTLVSLYLRAREQKKAQPANEVSLAFQRSLAGIDREINKVKGHPRFKSILHGMLATFVNQTGQAYKYLQQVKFNTPARPLERNLYLELARATLPGMKGMRPSMIAVYSQAMAAPELPNEGQIYYAFQLLRFLQEIRMDRKERIALLSKPPAGVSDGVASLLKSEAATLKIIEATDAKQKDEAYRELDTFMSQSRADYYLRKALYVRAILNFVDAMEFKYLNFVATNWLRYTAMEDTEFAYARDVYVNATLDRAYDTFAQKQYELAGNYFYGSLSLTDDLESHYGYIKSMTLRGQRKTVDDRYQNLVNRKFIADNMKFVEALLILIDKPPGSREDTGSFDKAIEKLLTMEQDRDSAVRYLLLGSCYLEKLLRTSDGYDFNAELFENAHHNLMLAYDLGRDNDRIEASALTNLGLLHQRVQNGALAARFFTRRRDLGFTSREEQARFTWFYSKALFYADQPDKAVDEIARVLRGDPAFGDEKLPANYVGPLSERAAFYLQASRNYEGAVSQYRKLIDGKTIQGDLNLAKAQLALGYSLFKLHKEPESRAALTKAIEHANRLGKIEKGKDRLIDFQPVRIPLNAYGLLSRMGTPTERVQALMKRKELLEQAKALFEDYSALAIENRVQLGYWLTKTDGSGSAENLREAIELSESLGDAKQYLSHAIFQAASGYLSQAVKNPDAYRKFGPDKIQGVVEKSLKAYDAQKGASPVLAYQKAKLRILWSAYDAKVVRNEKPNAVELKKLAEETPANAKRLVPLAEALAR